MHLSILRLVQEQLRLLEFSHIFDFLQDCQTFNEEIVLKNSKNFLWATIFEKNCAKRIKNFSNDFSRKLKKKNF